MAKRRGNPNWGKPTPAGPSAATPSAFESFALALGLSPENFEGSSALKKWAAENKNHKYVPVELLEAWGLVADVDV